MLSTMSPSEIFLIAILLGLTAVAARLESDWNQETRDYILDIHNDYRRNEGGCQINKLEYDMELEQQAKRWTEGCVFEHEMIEGRGENLAWDSNHNPEKDMIKDSAQRWFDEKNEYSYGQDNCYLSCHYTQLVWGTTEKVGCYSARCPNLRNAYRDAWYLVCFYTPQGNWMGEKPYERDCSSPCRSGQTEEDGLCVGKSITKCVDNNEGCEGWAGRGECESNPSYMKKNCKKSCKVCQGGDKARGKPCKDDNKDCKGWADRGECKRNPSFMKKNCKKSCKECQVEGNSDGRDKARGNSQDSARRRKNKYGRKEKEDRGSENSEDCNGRRKNKNGRRG